MSHSVKIFWLCALSFIIRNYILLTSFIETSRDRESSKSLTPACRPESSGNYWFIYFFFFFFLFPTFTKRDLGLCEVCGRVWSSCPHTWKMYKCERTWKKTSVYTEKDTVVSRKSQSDCEKKYGNSFLFLMSRERDIQGVSTQGWGALEGNKREKEKSGL